MLGLDGRLSTSRRMMETCSEFCYTKMLEDPTNGDLRNTKCGVHVLHPFKTEFHNSLVACTGSRAKQTLLYI